MSSRVQSALGFVRSVLQIVVTERLQLMAGGISYFTVLSVVPLLIAFASIAGMFLSTQEIEQSVELITGVVPAVDPQEINSAFRAIVGQASQASFTVTTIVAIAVGAFAAARVVVGMRMGLDSIFDVPIQRSTFIMRLLGSVATLVGLLIATLLAIVLTVVPSVTRAFGIDFTALGGLSWLLAFILVGIVLRLLFRFGSHTRIPVPWGAPGVWFAALWIIAVTGLLGVFVSVSSSMSAAIVTLGAPIAILLWVYLIAYGTFLGASIVAASSTRS
jgi:membrane protein